MKNIFNHSSKGLVTSILSTGLIFSLSACNPKQEGSAAIDKPMTNSAEFVDSKGRSMGTITQKMYSPQELEKIQNQTSRETTIDKAVVDPKYNADVYVVKGTISDSSIRIAPKVMVYSSSSASPAIDNGNGTFTLNMNIAMVNGLQAEIADPASKNGKVTVPEQFLVKNLSNLKSDLKARYQAATELVDINSCPASITISMSGENYDVTPEPIRHKGFCPINTPFAVSLTLPKSKARDLFSKLLPDGVVSMYVDYALDVPTTVGRVSVSFDKDKFFEDLRANLQGSYGVYVQGDIQIAIKKIIERNRLNIVSVGDQTELMNILVSKAIEYFFVKFEQPPVVTNGPDCKAMACFHMSYVKSTEERMFRAEYDSVSSMRVPQFFTSIAPLTESGRVFSKIGSDQKIFSNLKNGDNKSDKVVYSGLSAARGAMLNFHPLKFAVENRVRNSEELINNESWEVCDPSAPFCSRHVGRRRLTYSQEYSPAQWLEAKDEFALQALDDSKLLVVFKMNSGKIVNCPLTALDPSQNGKSLSMVIENTPYCEIFSTREDKVSSIGFINTMTRDVVNYTTGTRCAGDSCSPTTYTPASYEPEIRIEAEASVSGGIASAQAESHLKN